MTAGNGVPRPALIIGIGNRDRGDDAVGPIAAERLVARAFSAAEHSADGAALLELWDGHERVILVDAMRSGAPPGTIRRFDAYREAVPKGAFGISSHLFGPVEAVETARGLGRLPPFMVIFAIEGEAFAFGEPLSSAVAGALEDVIERVVALAAAPVVDRSCGALTRNRGR